MSTALDAFVIHKSITQGFPPPIVKLYNYSIGSAINVFGNPSCEQRTAMEGLKKGKSIAAQLIKRR